MKLNPQPNYIKPELYRVWYVATPDNAITLESQVDSSADNKITFENLMDSRTGRTLSIGGGSSN